MGPLLLAIPTYNCSAQIKGVLEKLLAAPFLGQIDQIYLLDNFSLDETFEVARAMAPKFPRGKFIACRNPENQGSGGSFKKIIQYAAQNRFEYVCVFSGSGQVDIKDLPRFLACVGGADEVVWGSRFLEDSSLVNFPLLRKWAQLFLNKMISWGSGRAIHDVCSAAGLYRIKGLPKTALAALPTLQAFDMHLLLFLIENRLSVSFVPISWKEVHPVTQAREIPIFTQLMGLFFEWRIRTWLRPILRFLGLDKAQIFSQK